MAAPFTPGASIPGQIREDFGGATFNALRTAARLGGRCSLFSIRGGDRNGEALAQTISEAEIADLSAVFLDRATPTYTALLTGAGDVVAALADMDLYEIGFIRQMRRRQLRIAVQDSDAVLCDANLPEAALRLLFESLADKPAFAIAVSPAKAVRLRGVLHRLRCLFMNRREAAALVGGEAGSSAELLGALASAGLGGAVVTDGPERIVSFDGASAFMLRPPQPERIADVTGAGDALAGAAALACAAGLPMNEAVRHGVAAAMLAVASDRSAPTFSPNDFQAALAQVPAAEPLT
ncbi:MAG TPA: PfkB family carbohydrate kinase [Mesorhizobium sp.]|nr:PfkB family carbohydrate kinase [Mesorhizobium sp.]